MTPHVPPRLLRSILLHSVALSGKPDVRTKYRRHAAGCKESCTEWTDNRRGEKKVCQKDIWWSSFHAVKVHYLLPQPGGTSILEKPSDFSILGDDFIKSIADTLKSQFNKWITYLARLTSRLLAATAAHTHTSSCISNCKRGQESP